MNAHPLIFVSIYNKYQDVVENTINLIHHWIIVKIHVNNFDKIIVY